MNTDKHGQETEPSLHRDLHPWFKDLANPSDNTIRRPQQVQSGVPQMNTDKPR